MSEIGQSHERAGWWRRTGALILDGLCIFIPSAVLGAILFTATGGYLQWSSPGVEWQICDSVTSIPANLTPPPPKNSNRASLCRVSSIAGQTGRSLTVGRTTTENNQTSSVVETYLLRQTGDPGGYDLSWVTWVSLLMLLIGCEWRLGVTPGKRLLGMRVVSTKNVQRRSVPLKQIAIRYGVALGGTLVPLVLALGVVLVPVALGGQPPRFAFGIVVLLLICMVAWQIWNVARIVQRRPTVYDHFAGVEVVRIRPSPRVSGSGEQTAHEDS